MGQGRSISDEYWQKNSPDTDICINQYLQFTQHPYTSIIRTLINTVGIILAFTLHNILFTNYWIIEFIKPCLRIGRGLE